MAVVVVALPQRQSRLRMALLAVSLLLTSCGSGMMPRATAPVAEAQIIHTPPPAPTPVPTSLPSAIPTPGRGKRPQTVIQAEERLDQTSVPSMSIPPSAQPIPAALQPERQQMVATINQLVTDHYLYRERLDPSWEVLLERYQPQLLNASDNATFYDLMASLIAEFHDGHSRFVPPQAVVSEDASARAEGYEAGIGVMVLPSVDGGFITNVFPNSPAARLGLRPRDRIITVEDRPYQLADGDLDGDAGTTVRISVVRPGGKAHDLVLQREVVQRRVGPYYRRFPGNVAYISIPTLWATSMDEQVSGALTELRAAGPIDGIILDLRSNGGGWEHVLSGVLSHFVRGQVGAFYSQHAVRPLQITPPSGPDLRGVPLVVLVDHQTNSYAEVLAAVLQSHVGARVVGVATAGNTETIYAHALPDGSRLWLAQEGFRLPDGTALEGRGVQPDVVVESHWQRYSEDDDPQLLEALYLLGAGPK